MVPYQNKPNTCVIISCFVANSELSHLSSFSLLYYRTYTFDLFWLVIRRNCHIHINFATLRKYVLHVFAENTSYNLTCIHKRVFC